MMQTGMLVDDSSTKEFLGRLVRRITTNPSLRDDLLQEAMVHLWLMEDHKPGQTKSWYLQSCKFHLQHYLASGRSIDSRKRLSGQVLFAFDDDGQGDWMDQFSVDNSFLTYVNAREIISLLSKQLKPREQAVLGCLADGLGARDIAKRLQISHPTAIKYRRKIASLAMKLGIASAQGGRTRRVNGNGHGNGNGNGTHLNSPSLSKAKKVNGNKGVHRLDTAEVHRRFKAIRMNGAASHERATQNGKSPSAAVLPPG